MRIRPSLVALALILSGCIPEPRAVPPPAPVAPPPPAPAASPAPLAGDWRDWPLTPGAWAYARDDRGTIARFGEAGDNAVLTLRCDREDRRLQLARAGAIGTPLTIRTTTTIRSVPVQPAGGTIPQVAATFAATDPMLEAIGFSRGRFIVEQAGVPPLVIPAWAEIERVIEDCRG